MTNFTVPGTGIGASLGFVCNTGSGILGTSSSCSTSDARVKKNFKPLGGNLWDVVRLHPWHFFFKNPKRYGTGPQIGLTAQEIQRFWPELVEKWPDGTLHFDYAKLTVPLIGAVQNLAFWVVGLTLWNTVLTGFFVFFLVRRRRA